MVTTGRRVRADGMDAWQLASIALGRGLSDSLARADTTTDEGVIRELGGQLAILVTARDSLHGIAASAVGPIALLDWRSHVDRAMESVLAILTAMAAGTGIDETEDYMVSMCWLISFGLMEPAIEGRGRIQ